MIDSDRTSYTFRAITLSYRSPEDPTLSASNPHADRTVVSRSARLVGFLADRLYRTPSSEDGQLALDDRIRDQLIILRELGASAVANYLVGHYQKIRDKKPIK